MKSPFKFWLTWNQDPDKRIIKPIIDLGPKKGSISPGIREIPWKEVGKVPWTIYCDANTFPQINFSGREEGIITDWEKRTHQIGKTTIKEIRGGTQENPEGIGTQAIKLLHELVSNFQKTHPRTGQDFFEISNHWKFAPRFENLQEGIFENVYKIDIKSCYANIMRDYPLPCGEPKLVSDPKLIEQKLKEGGRGFLAFLLKSSAEIKKGQVPFVPNYHSEIKEKIKGRFFLSTELFKKFRKHYKRRGKIYYENFWIFSEKKGCIDKFLNHCEEIKKTDEKRGKMLANSLYGYLGKNNFNGYHYHPFHLAVNHLAVLKTYFLYRQFKKENVLAIRSDCIYVKGELPNWAKQEKDKYHLEKYKQVEFFGKENLFIHDTQELKARELRGETREKLKNKLSK